MATYGKKKKGIMPSLNSFSSLRVSDSTKPKKENNVRKGSLSADTNTQCSAGRGTSQQRDWVDEEASILLDDTAMDGKGGLGDIELENLPQLPQMQFPNQGMSMDTSRQSSNSGILSSDTSMGSSSRKTVGHRVRKTGRKPALPRRSSKRNSMQPQRSPNESAVQMSNASPKQPENGIGEGADPRGNMANDVQASIERMLAQTAALKPNAQVTPQPKKRGFKDINVISRVRNAFNDHMQARSAKKRHDPIRDDRLLGTTDEDAVMSNVEIRLNEGNNLERKSKLAKLTGHGRVSRKRVEDDGKSIKSRKSFTSIREQGELYYEDMQLRAITRTPTSSEARQNEDSSSVNYSGEIIPDLPPMPAYDPKDKNSTLGKSRSQVPQNQYFDALLSSSPVAQSTPRIRLEPSFERDGKATLKNVPADSRSLFDPDNSSMGEPSHMDVDRVSPMRLDDMNPLEESPELAKRKSSKLSDDGKIKRMKPLPSPKHGQWETKKHPSPNRGLLKTMESQMIKSESTTAVSSKRVGGILIKKDANMAEPSRRHGRAPLTRVPPGTDYVQKDGKLQRPSRPAKYLKALADEEDSRMDIDELQLDQAEYHQRFRALKGNRYC